MKSKEIDKILIMKKVVLFHLVIIFLPLVLKANQNLPSEYEYLEVTEVSPEQLEYFRDTIRFNI